MLRSMLGDTYGTGFSSYLKRIHGLLAVLVMLSGGLYAPLTFAQPPAAPTELATTPVSPANNNNPSVTGNAEALSTVDIFTDVACTAPAVASGVATGAGNFSIPVTLTDDTTTTFYATATNGFGNSSCSTDSATYVEDSTSPAAPTGLATTPSSPANNNSPNVTGNAETGSTVKLYTNSTCTSSVVGSGTATGGSFSIGVTVTDDTTTDFYATATDVAGNVSSCSTSTVSYEEDSTSPAAPTSLATTPSSPANNNNPSVTGSAETD